MIGGDNSLLWHIGEDLRMFKRVTSGHPVVMGRRTFESLGRPLPGRTNVVITRNRDWTVESVRPADALWNADGVVVARSLEDAIAMFPADEDIFIIGGGEIYAQAMPLADRFYLTRVFADYVGDVFFPVWNVSEWTLVSAEHHDRGEKFPHPFEFQVYERVRG